MITRFVIWKARHSAKVLSKYQRDWPIEARVDGILVGKFKRGKEVR